MIVMLWGHSVKAWWLACSVPVAIGVVANIALAAITVMAIVAWAIEARRPQSRLHRATQRFADLIRHHRNA